VSPRPRLIRQGLTRRDSDALSTREDTRSPFRKRKGPSALRLSCEVAF
jgi:hypothetical protein